MNEILVKLSKALESRGFETRVCEDVKSAKKVIHEIVGEKKIVNSVGFGNSVTSKSMGIHESLLKYTENIFIHEPVGTEEVDKKALTADFYFTSANAISMDGQIVNIDGTGNRVASTCFGPKHVIYLIGKNKIATDLDGAIDRAKSTAVKLAKKYDRKTPCAFSGECEDCLSLECICAVTTIHRKKPYGVKITVVIIDEEVGL